MQLSPFLALSLLTCLSLVSVGCKPKAGVNTAAMGSPPPAQVSVVEVKKEKLAIKTQLPGRIAPIRNAEVRARATGILLKQEFKDGAQVKENDLLFEIDPAPLKAALDSATASLAKAEANLKLSEVSERRLLGLVQQKAVSQQEYDEASAKVAQSKADVLAAKAAVQTASLNLGYTKVTAPISGRIGKGLVTEGALVSATEATIMAQIQQLSPIYLDLTQASTEILKLRKSIQDGTLKLIHDGNISVSMILEDGTKYPIRGKLLFADITVDASTGMVTLRAEFENPDNFLLPGMFAIGIIEHAIEQEAMTLPQQAVAMNGDGTGTVLVVAPDNSVTPKTVRTAGEADRKWIITSGIEPGEKVIIEGLQKVRPGSYVNPTPYEASPDQTPEQKAPQAPAPAAKP